MILFLVPVGFLSKIYSGPGQLWVNHSLGGVLYEIFWCLVVSGFRPALKAKKIALGVFCVTCMLEFMQLWHPAFLESFRRLFIGRTLLGTTFTWTDFPYYFLGSLAGAFLIEQLKKSAALSENTDRQ